ncbi:MAG: thioredoxin domain-containing protein [Armatimonadetes bacterium]|nr:MAG: thioredoxin domain-containing protein [Armatimonadota bacterium]
MSNRLAHATSPYLKQHADNPVDWYEWGPEAFSDATRRDVPVLLSVGYSACHWCHVMAHESFEDAETAQYMNEHFVNVKVDREERPDIDRIYMDAVMSMTGQGGWPMTVFLTPDQRPIFAGTYFPKIAMTHHPSFMDVMAAVTDAWTTNREGVHQQAHTITRSISQASHPTAPVPTQHDLDEAVGAIGRTFDTVNGGFGGAPKFPQAPTLEFLMRVAAMQPGTDTGKTALGMLTTTLEKMARGGIYDHLLGGFARYSVDAVWLVPHFEKMLYDNALLARIYLRTWQLTGDERFRSTAVEVLDYLDGTLADPTGGIHSAEDADSEGEEGKFAVWSWAELTSILGEDLPVAAAIYGFTPGGNFEGNNIPTRESDLAEVADQLGLTPEQLTGARDRIDNALIAVRKARVQPGRDDKIVSAWNGFALRAFAEAGSILDEDRYRQRAEAIASFLTTTASPDGHLVRSWRDGTGVGAFADDLAAVAIGLYTLFQTSGDVTWFTHAEALVAHLRESFTDPTGGFYATSSNSEALIARPKNMQDNPTPSDNALALEALQIHAALTGDLTAIGEMESTMEAVSIVARRHPSFSGHSLAVWATHLTGIKEVALTGAGSVTAEMERLVWSAYRPTVIAVVNRGSDSPVPLFAERDASDTATAYVCHRLVCGLPITDTADLGAALLD